jgi:hypothetical protein
MMVLMVVVVKLIVVLMLIDVQLDTSRDDTQSAAHAAPVFHKIAHIHLTNNEHRLN